MKRLFFGINVLVGVIFLYIMVIGLFSCSKKSTKPPDRNPTINFNMDILPILQARCNTSGCHSGATPADSAGGLVFPDFESMRQTVRKKMAADPSEKTIIPSNADSSHLVQNIRRQLQPFMPPDTFPPLTQLEIGKIAAWINQGAKGPNGEPFLAFDQGKIYVANSSDGTVDIIDPLINFKVGSIGTAPSGTPPSVVQTHHLVVSPDKKFVYVTNSWSLGDLVKIDAVGDSVLGRVRAGYQPADIVISPDGQFVYTTDYTLGLSASTIAVVRKFRASTMSLVDTFPVGRAPHGVAVSKDGSLVLAPGQLSDDCWFIFPSTGTINRVRLSESVTNNPFNPSYVAQYEPFGVIFSKTDSLAYVSCSKNNQIRIINTNTQLVEDIDSIVLSSTLGKSPYMMTLNAMGDTLYAACRGSNTVAVIDLTSKIAAYIPVGEFAHAPALAKTKNRLYVACEGNHTDPYKVYVIDTSANMVVDSIDVGRYPNGIAVLEP